MRKNGFTVIEILVVTAFLIGAGVVLFFQIQRVDKEHNNSQTKTAINAIYHSLEEGFYAKNSYYPEVIKDDTLLTMDKELLTDNEGVKIGDENSDYRYEPEDCNDGKCSKYTLRGFLIGEEAFVKESRNK